MQAVPPLQRPLLRHLANLLVTALGLLLVGLAWLLQQLLLLQLRGDRSGRGPLR